MSTARRIYDSVLLTQPSVMFRRNRSFYFIYDGAWLVLLGSILAALKLSGWKGLDVGWGWHLVPMFVVAAYIQVLCGVFIHNCTHSNWPRAINRLVGEICGVIVMTRYASWEILHRRHHKYADDEEKDPHYVGPSFFRFLMETMLINLERNLQSQFFELWGGKTSENVRREQLRSVVSFGTMVVLFATWHTLLGPAVFWAVFLPSALFGIVHVAHFNWATHDAKNPDGDYRPINIDSGLFWLGNRLCFGLYYHANHHKKANMFNPMKMDPSTSLPVR